jgi:hypothetical protein
MPECHHTRAVGLPLSRIWPFVSDMDNWAPMMKGYVTHEKVSERDSTWTLKGDLGPFSKTVQLGVTILEWKEHEVVAFELKGIDEAVVGSGRFSLTESAPPARPAPVRSWWTRWLDWLLGRSVAPAALVDARSSHVVFEFTVEAQGPMGPMINALLGPWANEVASDLLQSVSEHLECDEGQST